MQAYRYSGSVAADKALNRGDRLSFGLDTDFFGLFVAPTLAPETKAMGAQAPFSLAFYPSWCEFHREVQHRGRMMYPSVTKQRTVLPCQDISQLTAEERGRIAGLKAEGLSLRAIAGALGRAASTISREVRRNALDSGAYRPQMADGSYMLRRQLRAVLETDAKLAARERRGGDEANGLAPPQPSGFLRKWCKMGDKRSHFYV